MISQLGENALFSLSIIFFDAYGLFNPMTTYWSPTVCKALCYWFRDLDKYDVVPALESSHFREEHTTTDWYKLVREERRKATVLSWVLMIDWLDFKRQQWVEVGGRSVAGNLYYKGPWQGALTMCLVKGNSSGG